MDLSEAPTRLLPSASSSCQSWIKWPFPKKLWKIINECKSGAIAWSKDGTAVVIDYPKFQSEYLDKRCGVFKTDNVNSFIRQLNVYGFRAIGPRHKLTANTLGRADLHVFRNENFVRDRPAMLSAITRKTRDRRGKNQDGGGGPVPSQRRRHLFHGHVERARVGRNQARGSSSRQQPTALDAGIRRAKVQRDSRPARLVRPLSRPTGTAVEAVGTASGTTGNDSTVAHCRQDSTSDTETSDSDINGEQYDYSLYIEARKELARESAQYSAQTGGEGSVGQAFRACMLMD